MSAATPNNVNNQQQHQQNIQMAAVGSSNNANSNMQYTQSQFEALKRQHAQAQSARTTTSSGNTSANASGDGVGQAAAAAAAGANGNNSNSPYMVLTPVAVPAHMMGQLNNNNNPNQQQIQQLQQQIQQQQGGNNTGNASNSSSSTSQILSFHQLPPQIQQQVLLQQQQLQAGRNQNANDGQQQQLWQQQQLQQLGISDIQELMNNNQLDATMMQQLVANAAAAANTNNSAANNNTNNANSSSDTTFQDLFSSFQNEGSSDKDSGAGSAADNTNKRLSFLEAQVQPVQRETQNHNSDYDDDLFKFFDVMGDDAGGPGADDLLNNPNNSMTSNKKNNEMNFSYLEPTSLFQGQSQSSSSQMNSNAPPTQVSSTSNANVQQLQQHQRQQPPSPPHLQQQLQRLQQQQQLQRPMAVPSQPRAANMTTPTVVHSQQGSRMGGQAMPSTPPSATATMTSEQTFLLPSTMVPPTVLASVCTGTSGRALKRSSASTKKRPASKKAKRLDTPQDVLMRLVEKQGHGELKRIKSEDAGYDTMPSPLQLSSFGTQVVHAVHTDDVDMLGKLLACGISPNPCNQFRDSILDLVCKRNNVAIFNCLLEHGSDIRVVDGFGRTPLHHCGWASHFSREIAEAILERDPLQLFIEDKRGQTPMEYVRADIMSEWSEFLEEMADKFWPKGGEIEKLTRPKDQRPDGTLPDPKHAVSAGLASLISAGTLTTTQFEQMDDATRKSYG